MNEAVKHYTVHCPLSKPHLYLPSKGWPRLPCLQPGHLGVSTARSWKLLLAKLKAKHKRQRQCRTPAGSYDVVPEGWFPRQMLQH